MADEHPAGNPVFLQRSRPYSFDHAERKLWTMYNGEAERHDQFRTENWKSNMDSILIFAGLFSAVNTAFIIEAYKKLQPDPTDDTVNLLTQILQLQIARTENSSYVAPPFIDQPQYVPPKPILICNIFWFLSLACSLACALAATLVQQWIRFYLQNIQHSSPRKRARMRAYLHHGLRTFKMESVVNAIPTLLHISLFFFYGGLVSWMLTISHTLLVLHITLLGCLGAAYVTPTILPLLSLSCPFSTPLTSLLWRTLHLLGKLVPEKHRSKRFSGSASDAREAELSLASLSWRDDPIDVRRATDRQVQVGVFRVFNFETSQHLRSLGPEIAFVMESAISFFSSVIWRIRKERSATRNRTESTLQAEFLRLPGTVIGLTAHHSTSTLPIRPPLPSAPFQFSYDAEAMLDEPHRLRSLPFNRGVTSSLGVEAGFFRYVFTIEQQTDAMVLLPRGYTISDDTVFGYIAQREAALISYRARKDRDTKAILFLLDNCDDNELEEVLELIPVMITQHISRAIIFDILSLKGAVFAWRVMSLMKSCRSSLDADVVYRRAETCLLTVHSLLRFDGDHILSAPSRVFRNTYEFPSDHSAWSWWSWCAGIRRLPASKTNVSLKVEVLALAISRTLAAFDGLYRDPPTGDNMAQDTEFRETISQRFTGLSASSVITDNNVTLYPAHGLKDLLAPFLQEFCSAAMINSPSPEDITRLRILASRIHKQFLLRFLLLWYDVLPQLLHTSGFVSDFTVLKDTCLKILEEDLGFVPLEEQAALNTMLQIETDPTEGILGHLDTISGSNTYQVNRTKVLDRLRNWTVEITKGMDRAPPSLGWAEMVLQAVEEELQARLPARDAQTDMVVGHH